MRKFIRTAVDLGKNYFQFHGLPNEGGVPVSRKLRRSKVLEFYAQIEPCRVGMEACGSAHYWARELIAMGHEVVLIPPAYIKPYVKRGKNDAVDAAAICEAMTRPDMRFVPVKSAENQAVLMLHKSRELLIKQRTMSVNALRGHLAEFGLVVAKGIGRVDELLALAQAAARLPQIAKATVTELASHLEGLDRSIDAIDDDIAKAHKQNQKSCLIDEVPRHRHADRLGGGRQRSRSERVQIGARLRGLAGFDPQAKFQWRQTEARCHYQTGQPLHTQDARRWCNLGVARGGQAQRRSRRLDHRVAGQKARTTGGRGASQQTGQDLLGTYDNRGKFPHRGIR